MKIADTSVPVVVLGLFHQCALGIVRTLGRLGVAVYGVHYEDSSPPAVSRYCRPLLWSLHDEAWASWQGGATPPAAEAVEWLREHAATLGDRPLLVATDDVSSMFVADNADALHTAFRFPDQPPGLARALYSKEGMYRLCKEHGVATPETEFPQTRADVERFLDRSPDFPIVVKGIDSWLLHQQTGVRMAIVEDEAELLAVYDRLDRGGEPNLMLQEYIPGGIESVWMFNGYFDERSDSLVSFCGRKLRQYPPYTGMTSLGVCVWNDEVATTTRAFMKAIGYRGVLDLGYRYDARDGQYKLLDVNPRVGATFRLFAGANGIDVVRALYLDLTGREVPAAPARDGRKWIVENYDLASTFAYLRDGRLSVAAWLRSFRGVEEAAYFATDDLRPFLRMVQRSSAALGRRANRAAGRETRAAALP